MKVFISWSGKRSGEIAKIFNEYLPLILQGIDIFYSPEIEKGAKWFSHIDDQLEISGFGIICLTSENLNAPWILYEAGALSRGVGSNNVCPVLIDLPFASLQEPLAQFNAATLDKEHTLGIIKSINGQLGESRLSDERLDRIFKQFWPDISNGFDAAIVADFGEEIVSDEHPSQDSGPVTDSVMEEILQTLRRIDRQTTNNTSTTFEEYLKNPFTNPSSGATATNPFTDPSSGSMATNPFTDPSSGSMATNPFTDPRSGSMATNPYTDPRSATAASPFSNPSANLIVDPSTNPFLLGPGGDETKS